MSLCVIIVGFVSYSNLHGLGHRGNWESGWYFQQRHHEQISVSITRITEIIINYSQEQYTVHAILSRNELYRDEQYTVHIIIFCGLIRQSLDWSYVVAIIMDKFQSQDKWRQQQVREIRRYACTY